MLVIIVVIIIVVLLWGFIDSDLQLLISNMPVSADDLSFPAFVCVVVDITELTGTVQ